MKNIILTLTGVFALGLSFYYFKYDQKNPALNNSQDKSSDKTFDKSPHSVTAIQNFDIPMDPTITSEMEEEMKNPPVAFQENGEPTQASLKYLNSMDEE